MRTSLLLRFCRINAARDSANFPSSSPSSSFTYTASAVLPFPLSSLTVSSSFVSSSPSVSASLTSSSPVSLSVHDDSTFVASSSVFSPRALFPSESSSSFSQSSTPSPFPFLSRSSSSLSSPRPSLFFVSFEFLPPSSCFSSFPPLSLPSPSSSCAGARFSAAERGRSSSHTGDPAAAGAAETLPHEQEEAGGAGEEALSSPFTPAEKKGPVTSPEHHLHFPTAIRSAAVRRKAASTGESVIVERARKVRTATSATRGKAGVAADMRTLLTASSIPLSSEGAAAPPARAGTQPTFPDAATAAPDDGGAAAAAAVAKAAAAGAGVASDSKAAATAAKPGPNAPAYSSGFLAAVGARTLTSAAAVPHKARAAAAQEEEAPGARGAAAPCGDELLSTAGVLLESTGRAAGRVAAATGGGRGEATGAAAAAAHASVSAAPPAATNSCMVHSCCSSTPEAFGSSSTILHKSEATTAEGRSCSSGSSSSSNTMSFDTSSSSSRGWRGSSRWSLGSSNSARSGWSSSSRWVSSCSNWTATASYHSSSMLTPSCSSSSIFSCRNSSVGGGSPGAANHTSNISATRLRRKGRRHHPHCFFASSASSVLLSSRLLSTSKITAWGFPAIAAAAALQPQQQDKQGLSVSSRSPSSLPPVRSSLLFAPSSCYFSSVPHSHGSEGAPGNGQEARQEQVEIAQFHDGSRGRFRPHPFNRRFSRVKTPVFPIEPRNLRLMYKRKSKRRRGRGDKSNAKGFRLKHVHLQAGRYRGPRSRTFEGGKTPLYRRIPKWPDAWLARQRKTMEPLNLSKLRAFIEGGRLDARFPITQRHLHDSRCVKVRNGVRLFNVNDYPFPYKIQVEVSGADQSSIDAIRRVGGEVHIVYRNRLNLRAHVKPYKFEVLPKTARPSLEMLHYLEKMRARGCVVKYIKPQWLIDEEKSLKRELLEFEAEALIAAGEGVDTRDPKLRASVEEAQEKLLRQFRLRETLAAKLEREQQQQQQQHTFAAPQDDDEEKNTQS